MKIGIGIAIVLVVGGVVAIAIYAAGQRERGLLSDPTRSSAQRGQDAADFALLQAGLVRARAQLAAAAS